jgi:hypothetical protein
MEQTSMVALVGSLRSKFETLDRSIHGPLFRNADPKHCNPAPNALQLAFRITPDANPDFALHLQPDVVQC